MGDQHAETRLFISLFEQYKEPFTLFANSYIHDMDTAQDLFAEAMMQYWEKREELPTDTNLPAYILTSIKNKALNHLRHLQVKTEAEEHLFNHNVRELNFRISSLESCSPSDLFAAEIENIIHKTMEELPEQTRLIFFKSRYENMTNHKIAEEMDISVKTVESHITKALKIFRLKLKAYLPTLLALLQ